MALRERTMTNHIYLAHHGIYAWYYSNGKWYNTEDKD